MSMDMDRKVPRPGWRRHGAAVAAGAAGLLAVIVIAVMLLHGAQRTVRVPASG